LTDCFATEIQDAEVKLVWVIFIAACGADFFEIFCGSLPVWGGPLFDFKPQIGIEPQNRLILAAKLIFVDGILLGQ
jgi:hypothetical protein